VRARFLGPEGLGTYDVDLKGRTSVRVDERTGDLLVPGFVDIHIHGSFGIDFMSAGEGQIRTWADELWSVGYEAFLPTTVTAPLEAVQKAIQSLPEHPMIPGFHLEGPFISRRFPGAQPQQWIADLPGSDSPWNEILSHPKLKVITLAPELAGGPEIIRALTKRGVVVSMGHTNATFAEAQVGEEAGARHTTHTYNAMRGLHHREAGIVGYALSSDSLACELIYDRHHVSPEAAAILVRAKPQDKLIAISDATMAAGLSSGQTVEMWGLEGRVAEGTVRLPDGTLAGSAITLLDAFRNLAEDFGFETAIRACCVNPRIGLGLEEPKRYLLFSEQLEIKDSFVLSG
jgi:N-acetylglucosamine-6-phosphate deacetylase